VDSLPHSAISEGTSPVTGPTLARALIGNTFILSKDSSQPRSAARQAFEPARIDSFTLPRDSTQSDSANRLRLNSGAKIPHYPRELPIPPVPPIPKHLISKTDKISRPNQDVEDKSRLAVDEQSSNTSSSVSLLASYDNPSLVSALSIEPRQGNIDIQILRRISSMTEGPAAGLASGPATPFPKTLGVRPQNSSESFAHGPPAARGKGSSADSTKSGSTSSPRSIGPVKSFHQRTISEPHSLFSSVSTQGGNDMLGDLNFIGASKISGISENASVSSRPSSPHGSQFNDKWDPRKRQQKGGKVALTMTLSASAPRGG
jgi:hypothetical protein